MNERKCQGCGIPIIVELSCMPTIDYKEKVKKKEVNYILSGYAGSAIIGQKRKCVKCDTEFEV